MTAFLARWAERLHPTALRSLSARARARLAEHLGTDAQAACACAHLLAALAVEPAVTVRRRAVGALKELPLEATGGALLAELTTARASHLTEVVTWLDSRHAAVLDQACQESAAVRQVRDRVSGLHLEAGTSPGANPQDAEEQRSQETPAEAFPPYDSPLNPPSAAPAKAQLRQLLDQHLARLQKSQEHASLVISRIDAIRSITDADLDQAIAVADGTTTEFPDVLNHSEVWTMLDEAPGIRPLHFARLAAASGLTSGHWWLSTFRGMDPRAVWDVREATDWPSPKSTENWLWHFCEPQQLASWTVEHPQWIAERLGEPATAVQALRVLAHVPQPPERILAQAARIAVSGSKESRLLARTLLRPQDARRIAVEALTGPKAQREAAAEWLTELADPEAVPALRRAASKERSPATRAMLLHALAASGESIEELLSPQVLRDEADRGITGKALAALSWFDFSSLPKVRWSDGSPADPAIIRWWVILADKHKEPGGHGLFELYLDRLMAEDAAALGSHILHAWIARDTLPADDPRGYEQFATTALEHKGLLALTVRMDGDELAQAVKDYETTGRRWQGEHRFQLIALHAALAANGSPLALAALQITATRHTMRSVQKAALAQLEQVAQWRGWDREELADRVVLSADFDDDGLLHLSYGERRFVGRLAPELAIALSDEQGRPLSGLPEPRVAEDPVVVEAAKKKLRQARRQVKSVLGLQCSRLYEAMCSARSWPVAQWCELLLAHPLMRALVPRLVWSAQKPGAEPTLVRPSEDGQVLTVDGEAVELPEGTTITVAHRTRMSADQASAWAEHLSDFEVPVLFDQLSAQIPEHDENAISAEELAGRAMSTYALRRAAAKRGYRRAPAGDGGWVRDYLKDFSSLGLTAALTFTGVRLPEDNRPCALIGLEVRRGTLPVTLRSLPAALLAECHADYAAVAAAGTYDPRWRSLADW